MTVGLAASLGGRNTWLKAPPVSALSTYVKPLSLSVAHEVGVLSAGTMVFTVSACDTSSGLKTTCSWAPGKFKYQPNCAAPPLQPLWPAQQMVALAAMSRSWVAALIVTTCCC